MENIIFIICESLILNYLSLLAINSIFDLNLKKIYILSLQVPSVICLVCVSLFKLKFYHLVLLLICCDILICFLITNEFSFKKIFSIFCLYELILFAIIGLNIFLIEFFEVILNKIFGQNFSNFGEILAFFVEVLFVFAVFCVSRLISEHRYFKSFLSKVSFSIYGKHIDMVGLLDSGNSLYDNDNCTPVIVVSADMMKNVFNKQKHADSENGNWKNFKIDGYIDYVSVGTKSEQSKMPVIRNVLVKVETSGRVQKKICSIGFMDEIFQKKHFNCIVHSEFI